MNATNVGDDYVGGLWRRRKVHVLVSTLAVLSILLHVLPAFALGINSATLTGGAGTVSVGTTLYAKNGGALTLNVSTSNDVTCVQVSGAHTATQTGSGTAWSFNFTAGTGDGLKTLQVTAIKGDKNAPCVGSTVVFTPSPSYILDNTGPVVTGNVAPAPNAAGWNKTNATIAWSATDTGSGIAGGPTPASDSVTADTVGLTKTSTATDRLGNSGTGSITVKLDKTAPTITGSRSPAANAGGWNNTDVTVSFTCSDVTSGVKSCSGPTTLSSSAANQSVTGSSVDNADNSASATVSGINIDKVAPTLSGAPTTNPNGAGWYNGNVAIHWTAADALSGIAGAVPADSIISSEGTGLTASTSVSDKAGNTTNATSSPAVRIDKTAPNTTATAPANWNNVDVTVSLNATDALSGVKATHFALDGGPDQTGTSVAISSEGDHALAFWSEDNAGNAEAPKIVHVKIDKTKPTINHTQAPAANADGWNNTNVTVTFSCADSLSGIASCTGPQTITTEGQNQAVTGTATDNAGNTATDPATVSIDKTAPTITAAPDRAPNAAGWYKDDVTVGFTCGDALSGIKSCPAAQTLGEGGNQSANGTAVDAAGNLASAGVSGINVDKTAPSISGAPTTGPNGNGWYSGDVTIHWTCADALSGIALGACPADTVINGEGDDLSASASVADIAGNSANATVSGIKIDRHAPSTTASVPSPLASGWYAGAVSLTLSGVDSLSGVAATNYAVDGGAPQTYTGPFTHSLKGTHTITFWSADNAGNVEDANAPGHSITLKIDGIAPTITGSRTPAANPAGWTNTPVTVSFTCSDAESGIAACSSPTTLTAEGAAQSVTGSATDNAGNGNSATVGDINIDLTAPVTSAIVPAPLTSGWYPGTVTVALAANDPLSGVASTGFSIDGGADQLYGGPFVVAGSGTHTVTFWSLDKAGNLEDRAAPGHSITLDIDDVDPTITGARSPAANAFGWNNTPVTVSFTCADAPSGVDSCTPTTTVTAEAEGQSVTGTAVDKAGHTATTTVNGISIDHTAPTLSGAPTTSPNAAGWYNGNVTIHWTAADALSGLDPATVPSDGAIISEGTALTETANVADRAGNTTTATSPTVKIDKTKPNTTATAPTGWNNTDVTVNLAASDNLSGVKATHFVLDGGAQQTGTSVAITSEGVHTLQYWSVDNADNTETPQTAEVQIDKTGPTITHVQAPPANANGWNNTNVTVTFTCADALSGIANCTEPQTISSQGKDQAVFGSAADRAGNTASDTATVSIDKTAPTIDAARAPGANGNGWNNTDVVVSFECNDDLSGVASCPTQQTLGEGANQSASGTVSDQAGNSASAGVSGVNVDKTAPTLTGAATTAPNGIGWYSGDVIVHWTCGDALSGIDGGCPADSTIAGEGSNLSASASATDLAGNVTNATVSGIKIDRNAPDTTASVPAPLASGWYAGPVTVTLTAVDGLSGVDVTRFSVDGGPAQVYTAPFTHDLKGVHTITFWSVDKAGNLEDATAPGHSVTIKIDDVKPTITGSRAPAANGFGWNNGDVTVSFACSDAESGIAGCSDPTLLTTEGPGQAVTGNASDNAGNTNSATVGDINIDKTAPTLTGAATTAPNAAGWYKGNVTIHWTPQDGLSGVDPATAPADSTIAGEGATLGATASVNDQAGNVGNGSVSGIKVDRTAPTITGATVHDDGTPRSANPAGWFNSAVRVRFTCTDALSGVKVCADDVVKSSDGANQSASGSAIDVADNGANTTVHGINIDSQAPQSSSSLVCTQVNGWCTGSSATVRISATDQTGLSGVKEIHYRVNGGTEQTAAGASVDVNVPLGASGTANIAYWAVDNAGNTEAPNGKSFDHDNIAPTVTHTLTPAPNAAGWNNADVTVHFNAQDDQGGSGVTSVTPDQTIATETAGQAVNGEAVDLAGNKGTDAVTVKLDKTAPTISGAATTSPNAAGWYKGPVTVHFTCNDALSGTVACPADQILTSNGANQSAVGTVFDKAGNSASATVGGINIDAAGPTIDSVSVANGAIYTLGAVPAPTCTATDAGSGLAAPCAVTVTGGTANGVGTFTFTATATDKAGNTTTQTGTYKVRYRFDGFLQPINDTAHQVDQSVSVFKAGSTVPVKFQLRKADGTILQAANLPVWISPAKGSATTAPVDESLYGDAATSGTTYRWDASAQQYIYNWGTAKNQSNFFWRIGVTLDDGQTYSVNIGLR